MVITARTAGQLAMTRGEVLEPRHLVAVIGKHAIPRRDALARGASHRLAASSGAILLPPGHARVTFSFGLVRDGDGLSFGAAQFTTMRAPGCGPESASYLLAGRTLFAGDTLFLDGAGRPDLEALAKAHALYPTARGTLGEARGGRIARCEGRSHAVSAGGTRSAPPKHARLIESDGAGVFPDGDPADVEQA